jgi:hypothetical protein
MDEKLRWATMSQQERSFLSNGCGPDVLGKFGNKYLPDWIQFESCNRHDVNYAIGCTEADRVKADKQFLVQMLKEAWAGSWLSMIPRIAQAFLYWRLVSRFGSKFFYYADKELTRSQLYEMINEAGD